jgi:hypothetical protein
MLSPHHLIGTVRTLYNVRAADNTSWPAERYEPTQSRTYIKYSHRRSSRFWDLRSSGPQFFCTTSTQRYGSNHIDRPMRSAPTGMSRAPRHIVEFAGYHLSATRPCVTVMCPQRIFSTDSWKQSGNQCVAGTIRGYHLWWPLTAL